MFNQLSLYCAGLKSPEMDQASAELYAAIAGEMERGLAARAAGRDRGRVWEAQSGALQSLGTRLTTLEAELSETQLERDAAVRMGADAVSRLRAIEGSRDSPVPEAAQSQQMRAKIIQLEAENDQLTRDLADIWRSEVRRVVEERDSLARQLEQAEQRGSAASGVGLPVTATRTDTEDPRMSGIVRQNQHLQAQLAQATRTATELKGQRETMVQMRRDLLNSNEQREQLREQLLSAVSELDLMKASLRKAHTAVSEPMIESAALGEQSKAKLNAMKAELAADNLSNYTANSGPSGAPSTAQLGLKHGVQSPAEGSRSPGGGSLSPVPRCYPSPSAGIPKSQADYLWVSTLQELNQANEDKALLQEQLRSTSVAASAMEAQLEAADMELRKASLNQTTLDQARSEREELVARMYAEFELNKQ